MLPVGTIGQPGFQSVQDEKTSTETMALTKAGVVKIYIFGYSKNRLKRFRI
jgi:hypothetical protein